MVGSAQEHRASIGYFALKLCSSHWKQRASGRARLGYKQRLTTFPGVLEILLIMVKLLIAVAPFLLQHNTPVISEERSIKTLSPRILDQNEPLVNKSFDQMKLVVMSKQSTTTVLTSGLCSFEAFRKLQWRLTLTAQTPVVQRNKWKVGLVGICLGEGDLVVRTVANAGKVSNVVRLLVPMIRQDFYIMETLTKQTLCHPQPDDTGKMWHNLNTTKHADWNYRHAALMAISASGEGCHKQIEPFLETGMEGVMNYIADPHCTVGHACGNAIGQMSTDFVPVFEEEFHAQVNPGILLFMNDSANPRVQAHSAAVLVNFSEDCHKNILLPYLPDLMVRLEEVLKTKFNELVASGNKVVLEQFVASVTCTAEEKFIKHYDKFMPCLKYMIGNVNTAELRLHRGKIIKYAGLLGLVVGGEKFTADATGLMKLLFGCQVNEMELPGDDPQMSYVISAWVRICKILGAGFADYPHLVMGPVLKRANMKPMVAVFDKEELTGVDEDTDHCHQDLVV